MTCDETNHLFSNICARNNKYCNVQDIVNVFIRFVQVREIKNWVIESRMGEIVSVDIKLYL